jgi:hypothetical protein
LLISSALARGRIALYRESSGFVGLTQLTRLAERAGFWREQRDRAAPATRQLVAALSGMAASSFEAVRFGQTHRFPASPSSAETGAPGNGHRGAFRE